MSREEASLIEQEVKAMLEKGAVQKAKEMKGQFLSNLFLVSRKGGGNRPVINLKNLNSIISYKHFKMEGLHLLKELLKENDFMCKINLNDAPLHPEHRKYIRLKWEGQLYMFLCLCFGLGPARSIFTKLLKIPVEVLRRINIRIIVYLDDFLLMS